MIVSEYVFRWDLEEVIWLKEGPRDLVLRIYWHSRGAVFI